VSEGKKGEEGYMLSEASPPRKMIGAVCGSLGMSEHARHVRAEDKYEVFSFLVSEQNECNGACKKWFES
jgi:hypothetical protein